MKDKKYVKVRDYCHYTREYRGAVHSICNLKYSLPTQIPIVFHNGSNYDYHSIIKELAETFKKQFTSLGENAEKYITFTVPIEKMLQELIKMEKICKKIYTLKSIDSARVMAIASSNLLNNLSDEIQRIKRKLGHDNKKMFTFYFF